jgi:cytochrome c-type biogenesis protein CcmH
MKFAARVLFLFIFTVGSLMAAENTGRYERLGSKIMCTCGCGQILLQCNHVGCPNSAKMIGQLHDQVNATAATNDDEAVLNFFRKEWGVTTVVEPNRHGFELIAWILPFAGLGMGIFLVVMVVYRWHGSPAATAAAAETKLDPHLEALRDRARKETEI